MSAVRLSAGRPTNHPVPGNVRLPTRADRNRSPPGCRTLDLGQCAHPTGALAYVLGKGEALGRSSGDRVEGRGATATPGGITAFGIEANEMNLALTDQERDVLRQALKVYLSDLREEITKTEKHEWKAGLHEEEDVLKQIIERLA